MGRFLFVTAVGTWLGLVISFSFLFLPLVHSTLSPEARHTLLERLFPRYYFLGIACGLIALGTVTLAPESPTLPPAERLRLAFPVVISLLCSVTAMYFLLPRLSRMRYEDEPQRFERLHRFSAMLNSTVLAMLILATAAVATR